MALKEMEHEKLIRIVREPDLNSYTFPGEPISNDDFKNWIKYAEESPTARLAEAKQKCTESQMSIIIFQSYE